MEITNKKLDEHSVELAVELGKEDLDRYIKETEDVYGQELEVDGFRKGKAPRDVIRKEVGPAKILEAALQTAIQRSLARAISEQGLDVLEAENLSVKENSAEKLLYNVKLTLFPAVTLPPLNAVKVVRKEVEVDPKEIDETLESVKTSRAILTDKEGPAEMGDRVEVDFEVSEEGKVIDGGISKNHPITIGGKNFIPGFEEELIGMKRGEEKKFSLIAPKDFANKSVAGKKLDFKVALRGVKKIKLPELNDDFAKSVGKFDNIDQLILNIKDGIIEEKRTKERDRVRLEIVNKILEATNCGVPEKMINDQLDSMIQNFDQDLHQHDMELGLYLAKLGKTQDDLRKEWKKEAERQVKMMLVLHAVARDHKIAVEPEEVDGTLNELVQSVMLRGEGTPNIDLDRMRSNIQSRLLNEKTLTYLEQICIA